ncbi:MAG: hypothetical protein JWQ11_332 [Rhizobacter sp.]|nr:hypothetical protein [Rhizobacter sp.]
MNESTSEPLSSQRSIGPAEPSDARIFRYVVRQDRGGSPNPYAGWCSLAVCKPVIRRTARVGDWIVGLRSRASDQVIYAMRVDEVVPLGKYWADARFAAKRPGKAKAHPPDNFYRAGPQGSLLYVANDLHGSDEMLADTGGRNALVSWHYWYFGDQSPALSTELIHLVHSGQGHALQMNRRPDDVEQLQRWLGFWTPGVHGAPIDAPRCATSRATSRARRGSTTR